MRKRRLVGYNRIDPISRRPYNWKTSINRYKKTGRFVYVKDGSGHRAGEDWGRKKRIDPESPVTRYGKNSPSFDEGVYKYKQSAKAMKQALERRKSGSIRELGINRTGPQDDYPND